jgi:hypothetical protein
MYQSNLKRFEFTVANCKDVNYVDTCGNNLMNYMWCMLKDCQLTWNEVIRNEMMKNMSMLCIKQGMKKTKGPKLDEDGHPLPWTELPGWLLDLYNSIHIVLGIQFGLEREKGVFGTFRFPNFAMCLKDFLY